MMIGIGAMKKKYQMKKPVRRVLATMIAQSLKENAGKLR
jgi:hypothetical protein